MSFASILCDHHLFSSRDTPHRIYQERFDEGCEDEQRGSDLEEHPDRMPDLVSESDQVPLPDPISECHSKP